MKTNRLENRKKDHEHELEMQKNEIAKRLHRINHKIIVMSGKGGVGKSSIAAYLAVTLAKRGRRVGLMDVDLHGPSIPHLLGLKERIHPDKNRGKMTPIKYLNNMEVISIEPLMEDKNGAIIWRGPLKARMIKQFIADVEWSDLDFLVIDSPPGTGDEPLTVAQTISDAEALIVTTPQEVSLADVRKSISFCRRVDMSILGIVENMSGLRCPFCGKIIDVFKTLGGSATAQNQHIKLLASLPLELEVVRQGDKGDTSFLDNDQLAITKEFNTLVDTILEEIPLKQQYSQQETQVSVQAQ